MKKIVTSIAILFAAACAHAQMSGCSVFLQGKYVEIGIAPGGSYGAPHQPAGYHGNVAAGAYTPCTDTGTYGLGFVADADMDGWSVGTPPFYGDYFLPGSPFEGWTLQEGALHCDGYNTDVSPGFTGAVSGTNVSYAISGSSKVGTWQGSVDSLSITQVTSLDTNSLFFTVKITLTNTSSVPKNDIYYLRTVDPDNDEADGGSFTTNNLIEYQLPDTMNASVVSATGLTYTGAYLALGTADTNAKALIYQAWPLSDTVDLATIFSETMPTGSFASGVSDVGDHAIGLAFRVAHLAPADSSSDSVAYRTTAAAHLRPANSYTFTYFYAFSHAAVDSALKATRYVPDTTITTTGITNVNNASVISAYPNPSKNVVNVTGLSLTDAITLYDMMGRPVSNWQVRNAGTNVFSVSDIPAGMYIIGVKDIKGNVRSNVPFRKL